MSNTLLNDFCGKIRCIEIILVFEGLQLLAISITLSSKDFRHVCLHYNFFHESVMDHVSVTGNLVSK